MKFAFIDAEKALYPITRMCFLLAVSRAGFYAWAGRPPSAHAVEDQRLAILVHAAHDESGKRYGAPRVQEALAATHHAHVSRKRVGRLMRQDGLRARPRRRFKCCTDSNHDQPVAANILARDFKATAPDQKWVGDTTELLTSNGKLFCNRLGNHVLT